jgi:tetratricopeptide (TPR) repeat protein
MSHLGAGDNLTLSWGVHMAEQARASDSERDGLQTGPIISVFGTSRSTLGDQFGLLSQSNSDQSSDLILNRASDLAWAESEMLMSPVSESAGYENKARWESDRYRPKKGAIATKMIVIVLVAMGATASAIAIRLVLEKNRLSADATALQIVVPMQTAKEPAPAVAAQSGETLLAAAEQNRPRDDSTNGLESDLAPHVAAADTKSDGQRQNALPKALVPTQNPARLIDKEELANLLKRGRYLLSIGDIAPARLLLERAADANEANAAFDLAGTYDPAVLARSHALGIAPDLAMARMWYEKALNLGHSEAQARLAQLQK